MANILLQTHRLPGLMQTCQARPTDPQTPPVSPVSRRPTMLSHTLACALTRPFPTPFAGDPTKAQQFLDKLMQLLESNSHSRSLKDPTSMTGDAPYETDSRPTHWMKSYGTSLSTHSVPPGSMTLQHLPRPSRQQTQRPSPPHQLSPPLRITKEEEDGTLFAPRVTPVLTPLVTPTALRVEKRKHNDDSDTEENHPGKHLVPLPRKIVYRQRHASSAPITHALCFLISSSLPPCRPPSPPDDPAHAPLLADPDPRLLVPDHPIVEDDKTLTGGVKTLDDSVFVPVSAQDDAASTPHTGDSRPQTPLLTPDAAGSPPQTLPHTYIFPCHTLERPRDLDELVTRPTGRQHHGNTHVPYPVTSRHRDRHVHAACQHADQPAPPVPLPTGRHPHHAGQHPHRAKTAEATPATDRRHNHANAAVEAFLRQYDAARPTPAPAAVPASRAYDAIAQHLTYRLATNPDTTRVTQPFTLQDKPHVILLQWKKR
ncbi:hypothetical protein EDB89DRAFT_2065317 [Lactarius sanguifluus]|nr:hypothetical protein EDB89DRAFT_2065317 [Lactarius sanguifluus]